MGHVRIVRGAGRGPTVLSSYDAALAAASVHDYNLIRVSSVLPANTTVDFVGVAPDLGPVGGKLTVVEARETVRVAPDEDDDSDDTDGYTDDGDGGVPADDAGRRPINDADRRRIKDADRPTDDGTGAEAERASACVGLGWAQAHNGRGIIYEATGPDPERVHRRIERGLRAGCSLRDLSPARSDRVVLATDGVTTRVERERDSRTADAGALDPPSSDIRGAGDGAIEAEYVTAVVLGVYGESGPIL